MRSTVGIQRTLALELDRAALEAGLPSGPGHRAKAAEAAISYALERHSCGYSRLACRATRRCAPEARGGAE